MDILKVMNYERRNNITKIAMIYLSIFMFFILSMNVKAADEVQPYTSFKYTYKYTNEYKDTVSFSITDPVIFIGLFHTQYNTTSKDFNFWAYNTTGGSISISKRTVHYKPDGTFYYNEDSVYNQSPTYTIANGNQSIFVYNITGAHYPSNSQGEKIFISASANIIDINGDSISNGILNYFNNNNYYTSTYTIPNTNYSDNALKLLNVNALIGKAALNYQTTVTWSGTSKGTEVSQKLQVVFGVKNETGSNAYENISPLLMDYDVTNNMYSTYLTQLETLYATSHSMSVDDIYIEYLRLCPYYEQGENKIWGQYTYINFNETYTSFTVTNKLNSFEEIEYSEDEKSDIYSNYDESLGYLDGVVFSILNVDDDNPQTVTGFVYHKFVWNDTHPTYTGSDYRVMAYWQLDSMVKSNVNQKSETYTTDKYKFGSISNYDDLEAMISTNTIQQSSNYTNAINKIESIKSKYLLPGVFMDIIYYLRIEKLNSTTGVYDYGGWVKIAPQNSYTGSMSKTATAVIESEDGSLIIDTNSSYGDGINQDSTEFGNGDTIEDAINDSEIDYTNTDISLSWFFDTLENLSDELGRFPDLFSKVFSFLPVQVTLFLSLGITAVVILRFLGR